MLLNDEAYAMIHPQVHFKDFDQKPISNSRISTGDIFSLPANNREQVDEMLKTALASGRSRATDPIARV